MDSGFITVTELQERLNCTKRQTVTDRLRAEKIRSRPFGNEVLVATADIVEWIQAADPTAAHPKSRPRKAAL
jgi:hypothetical protein